MIPHPFPVNLDLRGRDALVVGSDADAIGRARRLARAGARVRVLVRGEAPEALRTLAKETGVHIEDRAARPEDLDGVAVAYVATSEEAQAPPLHARALATGQLVCTVDRPELSTFINPAVVEVGPLAITVSTGGVSPALASRLRQDIEALFASEPRFAGWLGELSEERAALPRHERSARGIEAVRGFALRGRLELPEGAGEAPRAPAGDEDDAAAAATAAAGPVADPPAEVSVDPARAPEK